MHYFKLVRSNTSRVGFVRSIQTTECMKLEGNIPLARKPSTIKYILGPTLSMTSRKFFGTWSEPQVEGLVIHNYPSKMIERSVGRLVGYVEQPNLSA